MIQKAGKYRQVLRLSIGTTDGPKITLILKIFNRLIRKSNNYPKVGTHTWTQTSYSDLIPVSCPFSTIY